MVPFTLKIPAPSDQSEIENLIETAFAPEDVRSFYHALKAEGSVAPEWVAVRNGKIIGHISFVTGALETDAESLPCLQLTPLSILPEFQNQGIGAALTKAAHKALKQAGHTRFIVLGHPNYYPRFGYSAKLGSQIVCPWTNLEAFMAMGDIPKACTLKISQTILNPI